MNHSATHKQYYIRPIKQKRFPRKTNRLGKQGKDHFGDGTKGSNKSLEHWEHKHKDTDTYTVKLAPWASSPVDAGPPPTSTHQHAQTQRTRLIWQEGREWIPKGTEVIVPEPRRRNTPPSASSSCWRCRQEIEEAVIEAQWLWCEQSLGSRAGGETFRVSISQTGVTSVSPRTAILWFPSLVSGREIENRR